MTSIRIARKIVETCKQKKLLVCGAESCTGGLVSSIITKVPGCSHVFAGSIVSYANSVKQSVLGVSESILEQYGAVSEACAHAMALGTQHLFKSDISFAITGIAGPGGGTREKPVGTVWFSVIYTGTVCKTWHRLFKGSRTAIQKQSAREMLKALLAIVDKI